MHNPDSCLPPCILGMGSRPSANPDTPHPAQPLHFRKVVALFFWGRNWVLLFGEGSGSLLLFSRHEGLG